MPTSREAAARRSSGATLKPRRRGRGRGAALAAAVAAAAAANAQGRESQGLTKQQTQLDRSSAEEYSKALENSVNQAVYLVALGKGKAGACNKS